ncbi:MAG: hypothetical protein QW680_08550 [Pyrobaculum sp.]
MTYGAGYTFWSIFGTSIDIPAVLLKLVGLGYEVAKAIYRDGGIYIEPLPGGFAARRVFEDGVVYVTVDLNKWAVGAFADSLPLLNRAVGDLARAYIELSMPEPPRAELYISFGFAASDCRSEKIYISGVEFEKTGLVLRHGDTEGGDGIYISITPLGRGRQIFYLMAGGRWSFVVEYLKRVGDYVRAVLTYYTCGAGSEES